MKGALRTAILGGVGEPGVRGGILPLDLDFSTLPNGALPGSLLGLTFAIAGGVAVNTPGEGANLLTDPGLEANYTAGKCDTLTKNGLPTLAQSADVHGGTKAQQFTAVAFNDRLNYPVVNAVAGAWYKFSQWVKRTAGTGTGTRISAYQASLLPTTGNAAGAPINVATYTKKQVTFFTPSAGNIFCYPAQEMDASAFDTVIADDGSLTRLTYGDLFALTPATDMDVVVSVTPAPLVNQTLSAIIARANARLSPDTFVLAYWNWRTPEDFLVTGLLQFVAGAPTTLIAEQSVTEVNNARLELVISGTTASLWYNNSQVGTNQTITPTGRHHGLLITGGNNAESFFVHAN